MCTLEKRGNIYILTLTGDDEHRLNPTLLDSITAALHRIRSETTTTPSALITTAHGKYFSNGYDLAWAQSDPTRHILMSSKLRSLVRDLISLPMPTIAAVTGHASAGGFILAQAHDYVLMRKDRGFIYMSELDIKLVVPDWFVKLLKNKIGSPAALRDVVLRAEKVTAEVAVEKGIIYSAHDSSEETVAAAVKVAEELVKRKWDGEVYGRNRRVLYGDVLPALECDETVEDVKHANIGPSRL
ncbi:putative enoyl-CoA hydratase/isomerase, ClpP/crotonase-like domain superfamily [Helianthus annuus]|uniref:Delta(3)-Delta(2)-enoyl-CoA isomerase n=1 Tax=Helianthus annuus TaxID=4232 RepID=A0A251SLT2_HELAN|nr:enoyl-CoA delta isomerase 1, peroxisomal [Helianthus annuus]KAF5770866.1 putative enoyl-CoA hydratase/isomerase, ClpP/crotonase-like domain superfamily [Helianthus annuus]KAJ0465729.1 putative enoyl-CoA hydratase/isomerase, ClpP/crotonase-like domain superfamily [Helianthus annuus]KAJ0470622.1 putative enoyl-CoA hydratase/isomerase, ClpP/crotonase-like domain superfamily [Helianthus annuus]KAJ0487323.1 putative enoyl-CoA hydratase/isomerase, ClpP/crotonase-like domain superfamily [Helianthus